MLYIAEQRLTIRIEEGKVDKLSDAEIRTIFHGNVHSFCKLMLEQKWLTEKFVKFVTSIATTGTSDQLKELNRQFTAFQQNLSRRYERMTYSGA
jgi:viroplasmin and RNaseH domain-containing protein